VPAFGEQGFRKRVCSEVIHPRHADEPRFRELFSSRGAPRCFPFPSQPRQVFDFGREGTPTFSRWKYVEGWNLAQAAEQARQLRVSIPRASGVTGSTGSGRSRVPSREGSRAPRPVSGNILVARNGAVKITDFGISRARGRTGERGDTGRKIRVLRPRADSREGATFSSDLFAVGVISVELLLGRRLFGGDGPEDAFDGIRGFDARTPPLPGISSELTGVLRKSSRRSGGSICLRCGVSCRTRAGRPPRHRPRDADFWDALFPVPQEEETSPIRPRSRIPSGDGQGTGERYAAEVEPFRRAPPPRSRRSSSVASSCGRRCGNGRPRMQRRPGRRAVPPFRCLPSLLPCHRAICRYAPGSCRGEIRPNRVS